PPASRLRPSLAPCSGPSRTSPSGALARVLDRPCARRLFCSRKAGTRKRPPSRTRKLAPGIGGACPHPKQFVGGLRWGDDGKALRGGAFPFPCAVERRGTGTGNG